MPDGLFPTEPIFVGAPDATAEDDGIILMSGVDGGNKKGFIMIYNATTMDLMYHGIAPRTSLIGLHSKFYSFDVGCSVEDCTPNIISTSTTTTTSTSSSESTTTSDSMTTTTTSSSTNFLPNILGLALIIAINFLF